MTDTDTMIKKLCRRCVTRQDLLQVTGKRREELSFEFLMGAAAALQEVDHPETQHVVQVAALLIAPRGFAEIKRIAEETETPT